jgi:predicted nucleic acid-binding protein
MNYLLDTCVISELVAKRPNEKVVRWVDSLDEEKLFLSVITIGEIKKGIEKLTSSPRKDELNTWLQGELLARFNDRLVPLDVDVLLERGALTARLELTGKKMPAIDSLIAASALCHDFVLATRNLADFTETGVEIYNPWD